MCIRNWGHWTDLLESATRHASYTGKTIGVCDGLGVLSESLKQKSDVREREHKAHLSNLKGTEGDDCQVRNKKRARGDGNDATKRGLNGLAASIGSLNEVALELLC